MALDRTFRIAAVALLANAGAAQAGSDYSNSASYNSPWGMSPGQDNQTANPSLRDANGNLTVVNGQFTSSNFGPAWGAGSAGSSVASSTGGVGTSGAGTAYGNATAIGNQLNVVTLGNNNTVVVNANQENNGNQTATNSVNGH